MNAPKVACDDDEHIIDFLSSCVSVSHHQRSDQDKTADQDLEEMREPPPCCALPVVVVILVQQSSHMDTIGMYGRVRGACYAGVAA
jgi:hypothetical protein